MAKTKRAPGKLHPVVHAYVHTNDNLIGVLGRQPEPRSPAVLALLRIQEYMLGKVPWEEAQRAAESVDVAPEDAGLVTLFLENWAAASTRAGRLDEAEALIARCRASMSGETPPEIRAGADNSEAVLAARKGDKTRREAIELRTLAALPRESPRYGNVFVNYALFLAQMGRETEVDSQLAGLRHKAKYWPGLVAIARFYQCVETGRLQEAAVHLAAAESEPIVTGFYRGTFEEYRNFYGVWLARWNRKDAGGSDPSEIPDWVKPMDHLLRGQPEEALAVARVEVAADPGLPTVGPGPNAYNLVRAELANGHGEAARAILERRRAAGNVRYLDELFLARIALLAGDRESAAAHFAALLGACDKYRAHGRLDLELRMACELAPGELARLSVAAATRGSGGKRGPAAVPDAGAAPAAQAKGIERLVGRSRAIRSVQDLIRRFASLDAPVLITGETGTGKELVSRALHEESPRSAEPFLAINCGAIAESLLESELFGHERGAFTGASRAHRGLFEEAGRGTVLLDEIGEIPPRLQVALLRVIEAGEIRPVGASRPRQVACRILAATNADLGRAAEQGSFRSDLLFRLRRLEIAVPPLSERRDDVPVLADHFMSAGRRDGQRAELSAELKEAMTSREWPGNVRELRNLIERMRLLSSDKLSYGVADLEPPRPGPAPASVSAPPPAAGADGPLSSTASRAPAEEHIRAVMDSQGTALRRHERLRGLFLKYRRLTRKEIVAITKVSPLTATRDLRALCNEGIVEKVRPGASSRTHYFRLKAEKEGTASP